MYWLFVSYTLKLIAFTGNKKYDERLFIQLSLVDCCVLFKTHEIEPHSIKGCWMTHSDTPTIVRRDEWFAIGKVTNRNRTPINTSTNLTMPNAGTDVRMSGRPVFVISDDVMAADVITATSCWSTWQLTCDRRWQFMLVMDMMAEVFLPAFSLRRGFSSTTQLYGGGFAGYASDSSAIVVC